MTIYGSESEALRRTTHRYLETLDVNSPPEPHEIQKNLLQMVLSAYIIECSAMDKANKWKIPRTLHFSQIADIISKLYNVCVISCSNCSLDSSLDQLAIYEKDGVDEGIYVTSQEKFRIIASQFNYNLTTNEFNEILSRLRCIVPRKVRNSNPDLIAVNNGVFNYSTKELQPFSPEHVFMTKSRVNYNAYAKNITIHNKLDNTDWDVESWMNSLSDDEGVVGLLWEILSAIIRPNVNWNKSAWMYSEKGNNGKGTLCALMRNLCGKGSYASIPISDFGKEFLLEPLVRSSAVIVDENDVGSYLDKAANLKAVITGDVIQINRKFKSPIAFQFKGFMVQCLNSFPKVKDRSDSFYRRQIFIPMTKCFTGRERKYIKDEYLRDKRVLEYVLYKVLNSNFYELSEPAICKDTLAEYKEHNDPVRQYFEEMSPQFKWNLLPFQFLYDLYKSWMKKNVPSGNLLSRDTFITDLIHIVNSDKVWFCKRRSTRTRTAKRMDEYEPLIEQYDLRDWMNPTYQGGDTKKRCSPVLAEKYSGLRRY